jgi:hypothetical protein
MLVYSRLWHLSIYGACVAIEDVVCWIGYDPELLFLQDQAQKSDHDTGNEVEEGARET